VYCPASQGKNTAPYAKTSSTCDNEPLRVHPVLNDFFFALANILAISADMGTIDVLSFKNASL
jgi:hypothetical protein